MGTMIVRADLSGYHLEDYIVGLPVKISGIPIGTVVDYDDGMATIEILEKYATVLESKGAYSIGQQSR